MPDPDLEKRVVFRPLRPQFGLKISGGGGASPPGPSPGSATAQLSRLFSLSTLKMAFRLRG